MCQTWPFEVSKGSDAEVSRDLSLVLMLQVTPKLPTEWSKPDAERTLSAKELPKLIADATPARCFTSLVVRIQSKR